MTAMLGLSRTHVRLWVNGVAMRRYDEPIAVRPEPGPTVVADVVRPAHFVWRQRLWRVLEVQQRWIELGRWWTGPRVRAARGEQLASGSGAGVNPSVAVAVADRSRGFATARETSRPAGYYQDWDPEASGCSGGQGSARRGRAGSHPRSPGSDTHLADADLLSELTVWRVRAACGAAGEQGVFELAYRDGEWTMRAVLD